MKKLFLIALLASYSSVFSQRINESKIVDHISYLSSDALEGRGTASTSEKKVVDYIASQFKAMRLRPAGSRSYFYDFYYTQKNKDPHGNEETTEIVDRKLMKKGTNVLALLDNGAPYTVVIGAHHDHLGLGYDHNSLDPEPQDKIHNGADDNASGVAGVIELARYFSLNGIKEKYNFLFMTFSGEELGLIGSKKWCEKPTVSLSSINYMINMDMIGRLNDETKKLLVYGVGTSPDWIPVLNKTNTFFSIKTDSAGIGPSDQTSFYLKDIPVLHFFTGQHSDYHKPTDDADKINYHGEALVLDYIIDVIQEMDSKPKTTFLKTKSNEGQKISFKVTLGIMPDYVYDGEGMRLDGVTDNKPAAKAGLQKGDIIIKVGEYDVPDVQEYMKVLSKFEKGQQTIVTFIRNNEVLKVIVEF